MFKFSRLDINIEINMKYLIYFIKHNLNERIQEKSNDCEIYIQNKIIRSLYIETSLIISSFVVNIVAKFISHL